MSIWPHISIPMFVLVICQSNYNGLLGPQKSPNPGPNSTVNFPCLPHTRNCEKAQWSRTNNLKLVVISIWLNCYDIAIIKYVCARIFALCDSDIARRCAQLATSRERDTLTASFVPERRWRRRRFFSRSSSADRIIAGALWITRPLFRWQRRRSDLGAGTDSGSILWMFIPSQKVRPNASFKYRRCPNYNFFTSSVGAGWQWLSSSCGHHLTFYI